MSENPTIPRAITVLRRKGYRGPDRKTRQPYTAASAISRHERSIKTLLGPAIPGTERHTNNGPITRAKKARGHLLKIVEMTGESPYKVMLRLAIYDEDRARLGEFFHEVVTVWR